MNLKFKEEVSEVPIDITKRDVRCKDFVLFCFCKRLPWIGQNDCVDCELNWI